MEIVLLLASSSRPEPYEVSVSLESTTLAVRCTCPAGERGQYCKHKAAIVFGTFDALYGSDQLEKFQQVRALIVKSSLPMLFAEIADAEKKVTIAAALAKKTKQKVARLMDQGVPFGN